MKHVSPKVNPNNYNIGMSSEQGEPSIIFSDDDSVFAPSASFTSSTASDSPSHLLHNRYQIIRRVGNGAFGTVYLAADTHNNDEYAIKKIICESDEDFNRAMQEVWPLRALKHENLVEMKSVFMHTEQELYLCIVVIYISIF
jgi:hypothetical protein